MRILTNKQYDAICDIVMDQKKIIEQKEKEIRQMKDQIKFLEGLIDQHIEVINIQPVTDPGSEAVKELRFGD